MTAQVTSLSTTRASFPLVECPVCAEQRLAYVFIDDDGEITHRCLGCDNPVSDHSIAAARRRDVEALGYAFIERKSQGTKKLSGCGAKGVRGCGTGSCSSGSCGTGGSCGSGGCGSK